MTQTDINKLLATAKPGVDPLQATREAEVAGWSRIKVQELARAENLELSDGHWQVIGLLQRIYVERGPAPHARYLAATLNEAFAAQGGSRYLYQLFPGGPVAQGCRLAGVPAPHDTQDKSFGSTF